MKLEGFAARLRPRRSWEGLDLGFALGRTWFFSLWPLWWIGAAPLALLWFVVLEGRSDLWILALWWFKPLYEAPLVVWTSRALFGQTLGVRDLSSVLKIAWSRRLLPFLLWRRFGFSRSFLMPIVLLEGLHGAALRSRRRVLSDRDRTPAWLTLICYHFEAILWVGVLLGVYYMIPEGPLHIDLEAALMESQSWPYWASCILYLLAFSVLAPFYVCAGFALYLNRRTELEAWDLELAFRRPWGPDSRHERGRGLRRDGLVGLVCAAILGLGVCPSEARATELPDAAETRQLIDQILSDDRFGYMEEMQIWVPIDPDDWQFHQGPERLPDPSAYGNIVLRIVQWTLLALAVVAVTMLAARVIRDWQPGARRRQGVIGSVDRPDISLDRGEALPADLVDAVRERVAAGDFRAALALLYRGAIVALGRRGVEIPDGATEGDALRLAARDLSREDLAPFRDLVRDWRGLAYAHRMPSAESMAVRLEQWVRWSARLDGGPDVGSDQDSGNGHGR